MQQRFIIICGAFSLVMGALFILSPFSTVAAGWSFFWQDAALTRHMPLGLAAGGIWVVVGILLFTAGIFPFSQLLVARGIILAIAAISIPVFLFFKGFHAWYWRPIFPAMFLICQAFAFMGAVWLGIDIPAGQNRSKLLGLVGFAVLGIAGLLTLAQLLLVRTVYNYAIPNPPGSYSGDYAALAIHIRALQAGTLAWLVAGGILGWRQQR